MHKLSVNLDHVATLRQARQESFPDPVQAAVLAELGGADGITVHLRTDRRHIQVRDLELLRRVVTTELNLEMAPTTEMLRIAGTVRPDRVTIVPETAREITTEGGYDLVHQQRRVVPALRRLASAGIRRAVFIEADERQVDAAAGLGFEQIEINTDRYSRSPVQRAALGARIRDCARQAVDQGLAVHAGHGLDYRNIMPILEIAEISGFSIGFAIVARAVYVGMTPAVAAMKQLLSNGGRL